MGSNEKGALVSGGLTGVFWVAVLGFRLSFPEMIVPFGWALTIMAVGIVGLLATIFLAARAYWPRKSAGWTDRNLEGLMRAMGGESRPETSSGWLRNDLRI